MGTKQHHIQQDNNKNKSSSPTWLLNWFSQLTKPISPNTTVPNKAMPTTSTTKTTAKNTSIILPWKNKSSSSSVSSSVAVTEPINVPTVNYTPASYHTNNSQQSTLKYSNNRKQSQDHRPSITISLTPSVISSERRNSQQTMSSSVTTSDDQYSTTAASYYQRRDSSERSVLSELWSKARRRHPNYPKFHWPHRPAQSLSTSPNHIQHHHQQQQLKQHMCIDQQDHITASCPSSYRHQHYFPRHLKRHSISSLMTSADNTPSASRPNSVIYTPSQPASPNFAALLVKDEDVDSYCLNGAKEDNNCNCQLGVKKDRWVIKHELAKLVVDGLFAIPEMVTLPLSIERHVLQIGCGDAAWAIDVASQYSRWIVIGLDDSNTPKISASKRSIPRNLKLIQHPSLLQGLKSLPDQTFDFVSSRFLLLSYTFSGYQELVTECIRVCKPGGYIEIMEMDMRIYNQRLLSSSITHLLNNEVINAIESKSLDPRLARRLNDLILEEQQSALASVEVKYISLPLGVWGGRLGVMFREDIHTLIESYQFEISELNKKPCRTEDELEYKMDIMDNEIDSNHAFMNLHLMMVQTNK